MQLRDDRYGYMVIIQKRQRGARQDKTGWEETIDYRERQVLTNEEGICATAEGGKGVSKRTQSGTQPPTSTPPQLDYDSAETKSRSLTASLTKREATRRPRTVQSTRPTRPTTLPRQETETQTQGVGVGGVGLIKPDRVDGRV